MKTEQVNLRLEVDLIAAIEEAAREDALDRATVIRRLLRQALSQRRLDRALEQYQLGDVSIGHAAESAGLTHWDMIEVARRRGVSHLMTVDDVDAILKSLPKRPPRVAERSQAYVAQTNTEVLATLPDRAPRPGGILLVGINPSPVSVEAGHYYQGKLGKRLWMRLGKLGLLSQATPGREDDAFVADGHGLTDIAKRPTTSADQLSADELASGARRLLRKVEAWRPGLILFVFKQAATSLAGTSFPPGPGPAIAGVPSFLLSGPYAARHEAAKIDEQLMTMLTRLPGYGADTRTQRVTAKDLEAGIIRVPSAAKSFLPRERMDIDIVLRGTRLSVRYDPRMSSGTKRSGVLRVDRATLARLVERNESLRVSVGANGLVRLD